jgi:hypothetical protein
MALFRIFGRLSYLGQRPYPNFCIVSTGVAVCIDELQYARELDQTANQLLYHSIPETIKSTESAEWDQKDIC